ncbi:lytic murein transglycosylase [Alphaproteobacteria bacterium KMM 3653]|uniref:Lytic murein transglycosylase n=1 Tax=Harenicola maris TaxID=2841044 RepID=A0AAP2CS28_9RHOB|nr:lytic murein transglycosylase [Harenicola maris]
MRLTPRSPRRAPAHLVPAAAALTLLLSAAPALAKCGGSFSNFLKGVKSEAVSKGHAPATVDRFLASARQDSKTLKADRAQGVFKMAFTDFSRRVISQGRLNKGQANAKNYAQTLRRAEANYGVPAGVLLAFWALETDYGAVQGNFNTLNSLLTLSHDCRRPELFRPQIFAALELYERGDFSPANTKGAWAGEIGMVQMLPEDILTNGVDGDGDGKVSLKTSAPDALLSGAKMVQTLGWRKGEPWLQEVTLPSNLDWSKTGLTTTMKVSDWAKQGVKPRSGSLGPSNLQASVLLPQGRKGPAFLAYPNFNVYFEWNQSFVYVTTAAYFATRLSGAPVYNAGNPDPALSDGQMKSLQKKLANRGYDVGKIDGILGAKTRAAVQKEQSRLGLPADAWPTKDLLNRL